MRIKKVEYLKNFELKLYFNDNKIKIVDLQDIVKKGKGMFIPLKKPEYFRLVTVDNDGITICWPNGADLSPDVLHELGKEVKIVKTATSRKRRRPSTSSPTEKSQVTIAAKAKH